MTTFYQGCDGGCSHKMSNNRIVAVSKTDKIIRDYFTEKYKAGQIHPDLWEETEKELSKGITSGFGKISYEDDSIALINELKTNTAVLSAFKNHAQSKEMAGLLVDGEGKRRSWNDFRKQAIKVDGKYNRQWLNAEFNYATRAARTAQQWQEYKRTEDLFPNIEYLPSTAGTPRSLHVQYYGMIKPINDPIWDTLLPPNGWGCLCGSAKSRDNVTDHQVEPIQQIPGIPGNPGKERTVFTSQHPYVSITTQKDKISVQNQLNKLNVGRNDYSIVKVGKNNLKVHVKADKNDLQSNKEFGVLVIKKYKKDIEIREHRFDGRKNPEFLYDKTIGDRVQMNGSNIRRTISNAFDKKLGKNGQLKKFNKVFIGFDFKGSLTQSNLTGAAAQLFSKLKQRKTVKFVLLQNGDKITRIDNKNGLNIKDIYAKMRKDLVN